MAQFFEGSFDNLEYFLVSETVWIQKCINHEKNNLKQHKSSAINLFLGNSPVFLGFVRKFPEFTTWWFQRVESSFLVFLDIRTQFRFLWSVFFVYDDHHRKKSQINHNNAIITDKKCALFCPKISLCMNDLSTKSFCAALFRELLWSQFSRKKQI